METTLLKSKVPSSSKLKKEKISQSTSQEDINLPMIHHHDVLIIGGGLTGLRAALQISDAGLNGAVISKVHPLRSHSVTAQRCMNATLGNSRLENGKFLFIRIILKYGILTQFGLFNE